MRRQTGLPKAKEGESTRDEKLHKFIRVLLALLAIHLTWSFAGVHVYSMFLRTEILEKAYVDYYIAGEGLVGFREQVVSSTEGGKLQWLKEEGQRVAAGEEVAKIMLPFGGEATIKAPAPGIFSPHIDGLEDTVYPHLDWTPGKEAFLKLQPVLQGFEGEDEVPPGSPIFKIVDNFTWYYTLILSGEDLSLLADSRRLSLEFDFAEGTYPVESFKHHELESGLHFTVFSLTRDVGDFYRRRWETARVIYRREEAISLPTSVLVEKDGIQGVYRMVRNGIVFVEAEVLKELPGEGRVMVGGLQPGFEVVTNPRFFREGQRF